MTALTFGSSELAAYPVMAGFLLAAFAILMVLFCFKELRSEFPILDIRLLARNRVFALSSLAAFINYSSFFGVLFFLQPVSAVWAWHDRPAGGHVSGPAVSGAGHDHPSGRQAVHKV